MVPTTKPEECAKDLARSRERTHLIVRLPVVRSAESRLQAFTSESRLANNHESEKGKHVNIGGYSLGSNNCVL
jgi:hypothetical protein